jgi:hypothetical protein
MSLLRIELRLILGIDVGLPEWATHIRAAQGLLRGE